MRVVIDRSRWLRGEGGSSSFLLRKSDNKMCCLGFCMLALGYTESQIQQRATPAEVLDAGHKSLPGVEPFINENAFTPDGYGTNKSSSVCLTAMQVNDARANVLTSEKEREDRVKHLLMLLGFEVEFVDAQTPSLAGSQ